MRGSFSGGCIPSSSAGWGGIASLLLVPPYPGNPPASYGPANQTPEKRCPTQQTMGCRRVGYRNFRGMGLGFDCKAFVRKEVVWRV